MESPKKIAFVSWHNYLDQTNGAYTIGGAQKTRILLNVSLAPDWRPFFKRMKKGNGGLIWN